MTRHRRRTWPFTRWTRRGRQQAVLDAARAAEEAEQRAARRRVLEAATELVPLVTAPPIGSGTGAPSRHPGQAARSRWAAQ